MKFSDYAILTCSTELSMKNLFLFPLLLFTNFLAANNASISDKFIDYPLISVNEIEDEDIFNLIQENINNLKNRDASNDSANELINLIKEGYTIDPFNMSKLIATLTYRDASNNATMVIIKAIEYKSPITPDHLTCLIRTVAHADASNNATAVILKAIEQGITFTLKDRLLLAEISKVMNAKKNVEKIRKALHERQTNSEQS